MHDAAEQLRVVGDHEQRPGEQERDQRPADAEHAGDAEADRAGQTQSGDDEQHDVGDLGAQRASVVLIKSVRRQADGQEERDQSRQQRHQHDARR